MYIPLWAAFISGGLLLIGSVVTAALVFRGKKAELVVTEGANLRDDQRELINTLRANTQSYQDLLQKYADSITESAVTKTKLGVLEAEMERNKAEISTLRAEFTVMKTNRDALQAEREKLLTQAARVPLLEQQIASQDGQIKDRDKTVRLHVATIKQQAGQIAELIDKLDTAAVLLDAATRGQERAEGALAESAGTVKTLSASLEKEC